MRSIRAIWPERPESMPLILSAVSAGASGCSAEVYLPEALAAQAEPGAENPALNLIVLNTFEKAEAASAAARIVHPCALMALSGAEWDRDFAPWPAPGLGRKDRAFGGRAADYLKLITDTLIPAVEKKLPCRIAGYGIAGYSLAGLFAAHSIYLSDRFTLMATVSGSLWYDGWADWAASREPLSSAGSSAARLKIYVSLGKTEHISRNARLASVRVCTERMAAFWRERAELVYELNEGGHFNEPEARTAKAIDRLLEMAGGGS